MHNLNKPICSRKILPKKFAVGKNLVYILQEI
jgi:hypothetical protein